MCEFMIPVPINCDARQARLSTRMFGLLASPDSDTLTPTLLIFDGRREALLHRELCELGSIPAGNVPAGNGKEASHRSARRHPHHKGSSTAMRPEHGWFDLSLTGACRSLSAQNAESVRGIVSEVEARRLLGHYVNRVLDACTWNGARNLTVCEDLVVDCAAGSALEVATRGGRGADTLDACARVLCRRLVHLKAPPALAAPAGGSAEGIIREAGRRTGDEWESEMSREIDTMR